ncbi:ankyrin repeat domain-containing protein [Neobacillus kokaensis]|uniref:Ankyrin n=1 Tax=Neobacillus kokaensis TaxID=2759023 RepID=A0ABQ3NB09_9BACI|nr:ankyrin repeat domain-containing protein [Neobacillus kokaensis]GHI01100.1 hypothetical protein AM1BK_46420 [Neobacillus kokaensis]
MKTQLKSHLFEKPEEGLTALCEELEHSLSPNLHKEVQDFIHHLVQSEMEHLDKTISDKLFTDTKKIQDRWKEEEVSSSEKKRLMGQYLRLVHPNALTQLLNQSYNTNFTRETYTHFLDELIQQNCFPSILKRYTAADSLFQAFSQYMMMKTDPLIQMLKGHSERFVEHIDFIQRIAEKEKVNSAIGLGAGMVGSVLGGPVGRILTRKAVDALTSYDLYIEGSFGDVMAEWKKVHKAWKQLKNTLEQGFRLLYTMLIGGYFLKVRQDYDDLGYLIDGFDKGDFQIKAIVKPSEQRRLIHWMAENERLIGEALSSQNYSFAHQLSQKLLQFFKENPYAGKVPHTVHGNQKTLLEWGYLYRYGIYLYQIEEVYWKKGKYTQAAQLYRELTAQLSVTVENVQSIGGKSIIAFHDLLLRIIMISVQENNEKPTADLFSEYSGKNRVDEKTASILQSFDLFRGEKVDDQLPFGNLSKVYQRQLNECGIRSDQFLSFLQKKNLLNSLGILAFKRGLSQLRRHTVSGAKSFLAGAKHLKLHIITPAFVIILLGFNTYYFVKHAAFYPASLDRFYFEKVEDKWFSTGLDKHAYDEAIRQSDMKRGFFLLENTDVNPNHLNQYGSSFLIRTVEYGSIEDLKRLIDMGGVNLNIVDEDGYTPLSEAINEKNIEAFQLLLENGADPNAKEYGESLVFDIITKNDLRLFDLFVKYGGNLNTKNTFGDTPLQDAERDDRDEIAARLHVLGY